MKRILTLSTILFTSLIVFSCEQPTLLSVSQTALSYENSGGNQSVTLTANKMWTASSNQGWLRVSPSSGEGNASLSISSEGNTTYDTRTGTITIVSEELTQTISVTQAEGLGLLISQPEYNLSNEAQTIDVTVQANVQYTVDIDNSCRDWIKQQSTKGLSSNTIKFAISKNESYDGREGKITIRQINGSLSATVIVKQSQTNGLFAEKTEYEVSYEEQLLNIKVKSNVDYDVQIDDSCKDWISRVQTKGLVESTVSLAIAKNEDVEREGKVILKYGGIEETVRIKQEEGCVDFDDAQFEAYCLKKFDSNKDGKISCTEAKQITFIEVFHISSLKGIDYMPNLDTLWCINGELKSIDISKNVKLTNLGCSNNQLTTLDVSNNTELKILGCANNQLTSLSFSSNNTALKSVACEHNNLTGIDVSMLDSLEEFGCGFNALTSLDVSKNKELTLLVCRENKLTQLDVSGCPKLRTLMCYGNQLTALDFTMNPLLGQVLCYSNQLQQINIRSCELLYNLDCHNNRLTNLDVSNNTDLRTLNCGGNPLKELDVSNCPLSNKLDVSNCTSLESLSCYNKQYLGSIDVSNCTALKELICNSNNLQNLNVTNCSALTKIICYHNYYLSNLDISSCLALEELNCERNNLTTLDISNYIALKELNCLGNPLTSLDITNNNKLKTLRLSRLNDMDFSTCTELTCLECRSCQWTTSFDVSKLQKLEELYCSSDSLSSLDVSKCTKLKVLNCINNQLTSLDVSKCKELTELRCEKNKLSQLNVSGCSALTVLYCYSNELTSLDVTSCSALSYLKCGGNKLTSLDVSNNTALQHLECSANLLTSLDVSNCTEMTSLNCSSNPYLTVLWLNINHQYFSITADEGVERRYK